MTNKRFILRWNRINASREVPLFGQLHSDICNVPYTCCRASSCRSVCPRPYKASIWWTRRLIQRSFSNFWSPNFWSGASSRTPPYCWLTLRSWKTGGVSRAITWIESNSIRSHLLTDRNPCLQTTPSWFPSRNFCFSPWLRRQTLTVRWRATRKFLALHQRFFAICEG